MFIESVKYIYILTTFDFFPSPQDRKRKHIFFFVLQVVGGMTWCITTCNFDVDVDLLFQENSTIGQKM